MIGQLSGQTSDNLLKLMIQTTFKNYYSYTMVSKR